MNKLFPTQCTTKSVISNTMHHKVSYFQHNAPQSQLSTYNGD